MADSVDPCVQALEAEIKRREPRTTLALTSRTRSTEPAADHANMGANSDAIHPQEELLLS